MIFRLVSPFNSKVDHARISRFASSDAISSNFRGSPCQVPAQEQFVKMAKKNQSFVVSAPRAIILDEMRTRFRMSSMIADAAAIKAEEAQL